jgi:hypothetical protein
VVRAQPRHPFDDNGRCATGKVAPHCSRYARRAVLLRQAAKEHSRDTFNLPWLEKRLAAAQWKGEADDVQATLVALTARTVADAIRAQAPEAEEVLACGGGANNTTLMLALAAELKPGAWHHHGKHRRSGRARSKRWPSRGWPARPSRDARAIFPRSPAQRVRACWARSTRADPIAAPQATTGREAPWL